METERWRLLKPYHLALDPFIVQQLCPPQCIHQWQMPFWCFLIQFPHELISVSSVAVLKKTYSCFCVASPTSAIKRRRVSFSTSQKSLTERRRWRRSKEVDWAAEVEEVEVREEIEKRGLYGIKPTLFVHSRGQKYRSPKHTFPRTPCPSLSPPE
ncbi:hypothetical protein L1887_35241 [Cichorium endivia]|nr:hypothetical protein L1887_35241 [Cichorium endivia]